MDELYAIVGDNNAIEKKNGEIYYSLAIRYFSGYAGISPKLIIGEKSIMEEIKTKDFHDNDLEVREVNSRITEPLVEIKSYEQWKNL